MKTTVDLPDELLRQAKAEAALRGKKLRELVQEGLERVLREPDPGPRPFVSAFDMMKDGCGILHSGLGDLSTDPRHLEGFGSD